MNQTAHITAPQNHTRHAWFVPSSSTGKERDRETGYGYFGARYIDHELTTIWLSVDPMADKYPNISPYAYCAWNSVIYVDPDGNKVRFAPGTSEEFKKQFAETIKYMNAKGTAGIFAELESRDETIFIKLYADNFHLLFNGTVYNYEGTLRRIIENAVTDE